MAPHLKANVTLSDPRHVYRGEAVGHIKEQYHQQMLRVVAKSYYSELVKYGVAAQDVITVASHLLDQLGHTARRSSEPKNADQPQLRPDEVVDQWAEEKTIAFHDVSLLPLTRKDVPRVVAWLNDVATQVSFFPQFPSGEAGLRAYFWDPARYYFLILYKSVPVGFVGAENIDVSARKLEMRKLIGDSSMRGKGIGKRATFMFLYYCFQKLNMNKVYIHSDDLNIRNINLNSSLGFEIEGLLFEEYKIDNRWRDIVRMSLLKSRWLELFGSGDCATVQALTGADTIPNI